MSITAVVDHSGDRIDSLWFTRCSIPTPLGIGAQLGFYQEEFAADGISIRSLQESTDPLEKASHFEHSLPHSFRLGGSIPPIWTRARGQQTRAIAISWIDEYQAILTLPGSGIREPKDLRGRRLGLPIARERKNSVDVARASALRGLLTALELAGLGHEDAQWVDVPDYPGPDVSEHGQAAAPDTSVRRASRHSYTSVAHALVRGDVDAIYVKDVRGAQTAHLLAAHVVVNLGFHPDDWVRINNCSPRPLTVNSATLEQHPQLVRRFLQRVRDVGEWARQNPAAALREVASETNWTESWVRFAYGDIHEHLGVDLSERSVRGLELFKDFLLQWKFIENDFAINDWIDFAPLADIAIRPQRRDQASA